MTARHIQSLVILTVAAMALGMGCTDGPDPDKDDRRGRAKPLPVGQVVTDAINPPGDDKIDWKLVEVPGEGFLTVTVYWDDASVDGLVALVDQYGNTVREVPRDPRTPNDQIIINPKERTFYYVRVEGKDLPSTYSVQASFSSDGSGGGLKDGGDEPIPEFVAPIDVGKEGAEVKSGPAGPALP